jgi:hypothetical protein
MLTLFHAEHCYKCNLNTVTNATLLLPAMHTMPHSFSGSPVAFTTTGMPNTRDTYKWVTAVETLGAFYQQSQTTKQHSQGPRRSLQNMQRDNCTGISPAVAQKRSTAAHARWLCAAAQSHTAQCSCWPQQQLIWQHSNRSCRGHRTHPVVRSLGSLSATDCFLPANRAAVPAHAPMLA